MRESKVSTYREVLEEYHMVSKKEKKKKRKGTTQRKTLEFYS